MPTISIISYINSESESTAQTEQSTQWNQVTASTAFNMEQTNNVKLTD